MSTPCTDPSSKRGPHMSLGSARRIVPYVAGLVAPTSVIDVGCGDGAWLAAFLEAGVEDVLGIDRPRGETDRLLVPPHRFAARDLATSVGVDRTFDLAICLEVAEHLPVTRAASFVAELARLAPVVLFSAAIPFQQGEGHVNEQWPMFWADLFARHDLVPVDCIRARFWDDDAVEDRVRPEHDPVLGSRGGAIGTRLTA